MSALPNTPCQEKEQLLLEYHRLTELYARAVAEVASNIGTVPQYAYHELGRASDRARRHSEVARIVQTGWSAKVRAPHGKLEQHAFYYGNIERDWVLRTITGTVVRAVEQTLNWKRYTRLKKPRLAA